MKNIKVQLIINIITITIAIIVIILAYYMITNSKYSRKFVKELIEKNGETHNYIIEIESNSINDTETTIQKITQKDDARKEENIKRETITWYANDFVIIKDTEKTYSKLDGGIVDENGERKKIYIPTSEIISINPLKSEFNSYADTYNDSNYKFLKKENYNDIKCIVVEFSSVNEENKTKAWIDLETGFVLKEEEYSGGILERTTKYKVEANVVTNEDIDLPNLDEYTYIE